MKVTGSSSSLLLNLGNSIFTGGWNDIIDMAHGQVWLTTAALEAGAERFDFGSLGVDITGVKVFNLWSI